MNIYTKRGGCAAIFFAVGIHYFSCADPESFVRGGPTLTVFFSFFFSFFLDW